MAPISFHLSSASYPLDDNFTGDNGDPIDSSKWNAFQTSGSLSPTIQNNKLRISDIGPYDYYYRNTAETFTGDFEIQVDWEITSNPNNNWSFWVGVRMLAGPYNGYQFRLQRGYLVGQKLRYDRYLPPSHTYNDYTVGSYNVGKFKIYRVGTEITIDHYNGGWLSQIYDLYYDTDSECEFIMGFYNAGAVTPVVEIDRVVRIS